jgi:hypothetical protein
MPAPAHDVRKRKNRNRPPHVAGERSRSLYEDEGATERRADGPVGNRDAQEVLGAVGSGQPLAPWLQQRMEDLLGVDLTGVRVHTNAAAASATQQLHADAAALGADVFFAPGQFRPGTTSGDALIAHELTHVAQAATGMTELRSRAALEREADAVSSGRAALSAAADALGADAFSTPSAAAPVLLSESDAAPEAAPEADPYATCATSEEAPEAAPAAETSEVDAGSPEEDPYATSEQEQQAVDAVTAAIGAEQPVEGAVCALEEQSSSAPEATGTLDLGVCEVEPAPPLPSQPTVTTPEAPVLPEGGLDTCDQPIVLTGPMPSDAVLDPVMDMMWDRAEFDALCASYNFVPGNLAGPTQAALNTILGDVGPDVRIGVDVLFSATESTAVEVTSVISPFTTTLSMLSAVGSSAAAGNAVVTGAPWTDVASASIASAHTALSAASNVLAKVEIATSLLSAAATATAAGAVAAPATAAGPEGTAAGGAAGAAAGSAAGTAGESPMTAAAGQIATVQTALDVAKLAVDACAVDAALASGDVAAATSAAASMSSDAYKLLANAVGSIVQLGSKAVSGLPSDTLGAAAKGATAGTLDALDRWGVLTTDETMLGWLVDLDAPAYAFDSAIVDGVGAARAAASAQRVAADEALTGDNPSWTAACIASLTDADTDVADVLAMISNPFRVTLYIAEAAGGPLRELLDHNTDTAVAFVDATQKFLDDQFKAAGEMLPGAIAALDDAMVAVPAAQQDLQTRLTRLSAQAAGVAETSASLSEAVTSGEALIAAINDQADEMMKVALTPIDAVLSLIPAFDETVDAVVEQTLSPGEVLGSALVPLRTGIDGLAGVAESIEAATTAGGTAQQVLTSAATLLTSSGATARQVLVDAQASCAEGAPDLGVVTDALVSIETAATAAAELVDVDGLMAEVEGKKADVAAWRSDNGVAAGLVYDPYVDEAEAAAFDAACGRLDDAVQDAIPYREGDEELQVLGEAGAFAATTTVGGHGQGALDDLFEQEDTLGAHAEAVDAIK